MLPEEPWDPDLVRLSVGTGGGGWNPRPPVPELRDHVGRSEPDPFAVDDELMPFTLCFIRYSQRNLHLVNCDLKLVHPGGNASYEQLKQERDNG